MTIPDDSVAHPGDGPADDHAGHRARLWQRFLSAGTEVLADDELLELLLRLGSFKFTLDLT